MGPRGQSHLSVLPVPPVPARSSLQLEQLSRSQRKAALHIQRAKLLARDVIRAGNELWAGGSTAPDHRRIRESVWERADVARILDDCKDHDKTMAAMRVSTPTGHPALCRLAKTSRAAYGMSGADGLSSSESGVRRGDVVPAKIDCIDLPDAKTSCSLRLADVPQLAAELPLGDASDLLLPLAQGSAVSGYADPALRRGEHLNTLATMMVMCGLCVPTTRAVPLGIKLFCVAKNEKVGEAKSQRLIWDCRPVSEMCRPPPPTRMASVGSIVEIELGSIADVELGSQSQGEFFGLACTDLPCFFYSLKGLVPGLEKLCVLEGVDVGVVRANLQELANSGSPLSPEASAQASSTHALNLRRYGDNYAERAARVLSEKWPEGSTHTDLGCTAAPMGFSWSPFIAQCVSSKLANDACPHSLHVVHKGGMRRMEGSVVMTYLDDLAGICRGATEKAAMSASAGILQALKQKAVDYGLDTHKDQLGTDVTELGIRLRAMNNTVIATPEPGRFCLLLHATAFLVTCKYVTKEAFLSVLGHFAWVLQLQRSQYSCLAACYDAAITTSGRIEITPAVRQELTWLLRLAPVLRADLGAPLCPRTYMVDAGPEGGAVVWAPLSYGEKYSTDVQLINYPQPKWKLGPLGKWQRNEHNNLTEARTNLWALQHAGRSEVQRAQRENNIARRRRVVVFTDSLVALGSFTKGRSSSRSLNRYCRKQASLAALLGVVPVLRYVATDQNLADGPSRGIRFPCVHSETAQKAAVKAAGKAALPLAATMTRPTRSVTPDASACESHESSVSDGEYHLCKSDLGDELGMARLWSPPRSIMDRPMWAADREVAEVLAARRHNKLK